MASRLGGIWFGDRTSLDAATQPAHAATLTSALIQRGHLTAIVPPAPETQMSDQEQEVRPARRIPARNSPQSANGANRPSMSAPARRRELIVQREPAESRRPQPRIG
jgi:hypothetical protein